MEVDILIDGRKAGTATIEVRIPRELQQRHAITERAILDAAMGSAPTWRCMGEVTFALRDARCPHCDF